MTDPIPNNPAALPILRPTIFPATVVSGILLNGPRQCSQVFQTMDAIIQQEHPQAWNIVALDQIHSNIIICVPPVTFCPKADGVITHQRGILLTIRMADCIALLLADQHSSVVAALHAGWRGLRSGIIARCLTMLTKHFAVYSAQLYAYLSPCISVQAYEVGKDVAQFFPHTVQRDPQTGRYCVDLRAEARRQLLTAGLPADHIEISPLCTYYTPFCPSYRRDGNRAGRMIAYIGLTP